jgi:Tfp pilus assembly PilM family ATPase
MAWGLEIDTDMVRLCRAEMRRGRLHLKRRTEVAVPPGLVRPSPKDLNVTDGAALSGVLRELCKSAGCRGWVRVALPDPIFVLRTLATNEVPPKREEARRFLCWQARELFPFPQEEARLDFLTAPAGADGRPRATCLVARGRILAEYEDSLSRVGLQAAVLDARSICLAQAASTALVQGSTGLLAVGEKRSTLLILQDGQPRFWRHLPEGREGWATGDRARLLREVTDSITYSQESERWGALQSMHVTGPRSTAGEVASALGEWLPVPVTALDLGEALGAGGRPDDLVRWGPAIGAAIRPC